MIRKISSDRKIRETRYDSRSRNSLSADLLTAEEKRRRLACELRKLKRREEQHMAEDGLGACTWASF